MFNGVKFSFQSVKGYFSSTITKLKLFLEDTKYKFNHLYDTNYQTGLYHLEKKHIWDATFRFKIVSKFWPNKSDGRYQYAFCLVLQGLKEDAKKVLNDILKKDKNYNLASKLLKRLDNNEESQIIEEFNKKFIVENEPNTTNKEENISNSTINNNSPFITNKKKFIKKKNIKKYK